MEKKTLVSILAMASVSMGAYADANVEQNIGMTTDDWAGAPQIGEDEVIVSPNGATISQKISLLPGSYVFKANSTNAQFKISGAAVSGWNAGTGAFTVTGNAATDVTIEISAKTANTDFQAYGLTLTLQFEFNEAQQLLATKLSEVVKKIDMDAEFASELNLKASDLAKQIATIKDDGADGTAAYQIYKEFELYKGLDASKIMESVKNFDAEVTGAADNFAPYKASLGVYDVQNKAYQGYLAAIEGIQDADLKNYVETVTATLSGQINVAINEFKTKIDEAYSNKTAATVCTEQFNTQFTTEVSGKLTTLASDIELAKKDHPAYLRLIELVNKQKAANTEASQTVTKKLSGGVDAAIAGFETFEFPDVYGTLRANASSEFSSQVLQVILGVENEIKANNHIGVSDKEAGYTNTLNGLTGIISGIQGEYVDKANALKTAYATAIQDKDALQNTLNPIKNIIDEEGVAVSYEYAQNLIDQFASQIEKDNEAADGIIDSKDYTTTIANVNKAIEDLVVDALGSWNDYDAYLKVNDEIDRLTQVLSEAKTTVAGYKADGYTTTGKYTKLETELGDAIKGLSTTLSAAFKNQKGAGWVTTWKTEQKYNDAIADPTGIETKITTYKNNAKAALDAYNTVQTALPNFQAVIDELSETVGLNVTVWVYEGGVPTTKTYGEAITELQKVKDGFVTALTEAMAKTEGEHVTAMGNVASQVDESTLLDEAGKLCENFADDKLAYEKDVVKDAIDQLLEDAKTVIANTQSRIDGLDLTNLGKNTTQIEEDKEDLQEALDAQSGRIPSDLTGAYNAETMALLTEINEALTGEGGIEGRVAALEDKIEKIQDAYLANGTAYATAKAEYNLILKMLTGDGSDAYPGVAASNEDPNKIGYFGGEIGKIQSDLGTLLGEMDISNTNETMIKDCEDTVDEEQGNIPGYTSRLEALKKSTEDLLGEAKAATTNWKAYDALCTYYGSGNGNLDIANKITTEQNKITETVYGISAAHYKSLLTGYNSDFTTLKNKIDASYNAGTSANDYEGQKKELEALHASIVVVNENAQLNKEAYDEHVAAYKNLEAYWEEVYNYIYTNDESQKRDEYLKQLTDVQADYQSYRTEIENFFKDGLSQDNDVLGKLSEYTTKIKGIKDEQSDGYEQVIKDENAACYERFIFAAGEVRAAYTKALEDIRVFSSLPYSEWKETINGAVTTANDAINGLLTDLRDIEDEALKAYKETPANTLFDEEETYKAEALKLVGQIETAITTMASTVQTNAETLLNSEIAEMNSLKSTAAAELAGHFTNKGADYPTNQAILDNAFKDVETIINSAQTAVDNDKELALVVVDHMNALATVDALLKADKEKAARKYGNAEIERTGNIIETHQTALKNFVYQNDETLEKRQQYIDRYQEIVDDYYKNQIAAFQNAGQVYSAALDQLNSDLAKFSEKANALYGEAKTLSDNQALNQKAYKKLNELLETATGDLVALKSYVAAYIITDTYTAAIEANLEAMIANVEKWYITAPEQGGDCATNERTATVAINSYITAIKDAYNDVNNDEYNRLAIEINNLDGDQNKAAEAVENSGNPDDIETVAGYLDIIATLYDDFSNIALQNKTNEQKQEIFIGFEKRIAQIREELYGYYSGTAGTSDVKGQLAELSSDLNGQLGDLQDLLNSAETHQEVKDLFAPQVEAAAEDVAEWNAQYEKYSADQLVFAQSKLEAMATTIANSMTTITTDLNREEAKYDLHDNIKGLLQEKIDNLRGALVELDGRVKGFTYQLTNYSDRYDEIYKDISQAKSKLDQVTGLLDSDDLTNNSIVNQTYISGLITSLDKLANKTEWNGHIGALSGQYDVVAGLINALEDGTSEYACTDAVLESLKETSGNLDKSIVALRNYNFVSAEYGEVWADIYGNPYTAPQPVNYLENAVTEIKDRIAELTTSVSELDKEVKANRYMVGDVTRDDQILVDDYMEILNIALMSDEDKEQVKLEEEVKFLAADANKDGSVNVGDLTRVISLIMEDNTTKLQKVRARVATDVDDAIALALENQEGVQRIAVRLSNASAYTAYQMDVKLPAGVSVMGTSLGDAAADHEVYTNTLADGTCRVIVASMQNSTFADSNDALIYLEVSGKAAAQVTVTKAMAADATGKVYNVRGIGGGETTGIDGVTADQSMKAKIYSVGGQLMDKVTRGINIIRNADGTTKKVLKK